MQGRALGCLENGLGLGEGQRLGRAAFLALGDLAQEHDVALHLVAGLSA